MSADPNEANLDKVSGAHTAGESMTVSHAEADLGTRRGRKSIVREYAEAIISACGELNNAVLAHLQQGSVRVGLGERVRRGQHIAAIGDSGNSLVPHLHLQVQDGPQSGEHVHTIPIVFRNVVLIRDGAESTPARADLRRGDHIQPVTANADPGSPGACTTRVEPVRVVSPDDRGDEQVGAWRRPASGLSP